MKILRIIPSMHPKQGGPSQGIRNSIPEMVKLGIENHVVCLDSHESDYPIKDNFPIYKLGREANAWAYNSDLIPWLLENFSKFDVVIVHGLWLYHSYAALKAMAKYKKNNAIAPKIYLMPHGMLDPYFQKTSGRKLKAIRNWLYWKLIEENVVASTDGVLFTCEGELLLAREAFSPYRPKKELNVGYGIQPPPAYVDDMRKDFKEKVPFWNGIPYLLFLSRIHPKKGIDLIINAYLKLEKQGADMPQLVIAGPGLATGFGQEMVNLAAASSHILFPGMLSGNAKWGAFYSCEAFVLPSHQENFGIAIVEAMACAKAVLITDKVNIWHEIKDGNAGLVSNDTALDVFLQLQKWMLLKRDEKLEFGNNAYKTYNNCFSIKKVARKMIDML